MKNSSATIGNRSRHLPACSAVPQPAAPPQLVRILAAVPFNVAYDWFSSLLHNCRYNTLGTEHGHFQFTVHIHPPYILRPLKYVMGTYTIATPREAAFLCDSQECPVSNTSLKPYIATSCWSLWLRYLKAETCVEVSFYRPTRWKIPEGGIFCIHHQNNLTAHTYIRG